MIRNSTIKPHIGICPLCTDSQPKPLTNKLCAYHYWNLVRLKSAGKEKPKQIEPSLQDLIKDADAIFSKYIRLKNADSNGYILCYTCGKYMSWKVAQCGHFIKRGCLWLRLDERNARPQCERCNIVLKGNYEEYARRLEKEKPGIVEILMDESRVPWHPTKQDIRSIIADCVIKVGNLKKIKV